MTKILRLTQNELNDIVERSAKRIIEQQTRKAPMKEGYVDMEREIRLAQQALMKIGKILPDVGLRLSDTQFESLYQKAKDSIVALNNALIKHIRGEK